MEDYLNKVLNEIIDFNQNPKNFMKVNLTVGIDRGKSVENGNSTFKAV